MDQEGQKSMLHHYAGNWMLKARYCLRKGKSSDQYRMGLIEKLKTLGSESTVEQCVTFLENSKWLTPGDVQAFQDYYNKIK